MSTVDKDAAPEPQATPETVEEQTVEVTPAEEVAEDETMDLVEYEDDEDESLLGPIFGAESMAVTSLVILALTFFNTIQNLTNMIVADQTPTQESQVSWIGKGWAIGGLLTLLFTVVGHLTIKRSTSAWAKGVIGAATILGLLFIIIGLVVVLRAGEYQQPAVG